MRKSTNCLVALGSLLLASAAAAQTVNFACKGTGGWEPESRYFDTYAGRCDANGRLQGEGVARGRQGYLKAQFIDGLPAAGPASMSTDWKVFSPRESVPYAPVCKMNFVSATELAGAIECSVQTLVAGSPFTRVWSLSAASGFRVGATERGAQGRPGATGASLTASGVLVKLDGPVNLNLPRDLQDDRGREYSARLLGTVDLDGAPLLGLIAGDLSLQSSKVELKTLDVNSIPSRSVYLTRMSGQIDIRFRDAQFNAGDNRFHVSSERSRLAGGHPADRELTVAYSNGYEASVINLGRDSAYFFFKDNRDLEFNGLIPECLTGRRSPGVLRFANKWPARYLLTDTVVSMGVARRSTGNQAFPSGCGMFKTSGNAEMRGEYKSEELADRIEFTPF